MKMKLFGLTETKLFHFHRIFKKGGQGGGFKRTPLLIHHWIKSNCIKTLYPLQLSIFHPTQILMPQQHFISLIRIFMVQKKNIKRLKYVHGRRMTMKRNSFEDREK